MLDAFLLDGRVDHRAADVVARTRRPRHRGEVGGDFYMHSLCLSYFIELFTLFVYFIELFTLFVYLELFTLFVYLKELFTLFVYSRATI